MRRSVILRGFLGAAICAAALTGVALLAPVVSRWLDGTNQARPDAPAAIATIPSDIGPAPGPDTAAAAKHKHKRRAPAKAKAHERPAVLVGGSVVIVNGTGPSAGSAPAQASAHEPPAVLGGGGVGIVNGPGSGTGTAPADAAPADAAPVPAQR